MGFGRKIDNGIDLVNPHYPRDKLGIVDIAMHKHIPIAAMLFFKGGEILAVPRIGQIVQVDDMHIVVGFEHIVDEVGTDESASAGNKNVHGSSLVDRGDRITMSDQRKAIPCLR